MGGGGGVHYVTVVPMASYSSPLIFEIYVFVSSKLLFLLSSIIKSDLPHHLYTILDLE